jgi:hypothetical protein
LCENNMSTSMCTCRDRWRRGDGGGVAGTSMGGAGGKVCCKGEGGRFVCLHTN